MKYHKYKHKEGGYTRRRNSRGGFSTGPAMSGGGCLGVLIFAIIGYVIYKILRIRNERHESGVVRGNVDLAGFEINYHYPCKNEPEENIMMIKNINNSPVVKVTKLLDQSIVVDVGLQHGRVGRYVFRKQSDELYSFHSAFIMGTTE